MSIHAGFLKRVFSFIIDLTLVILVTWLLYMFPCQQIIGKSIDSQYNKNIKKPYNEISEAYSGTVSYFGSSKDGHFTILQKAYNQGKGTLTETELNKYRSIQTKNYNLVIETINNMVASSESEYDSETKYEDQFYSLAYEAYEYLYYSYTIRKQFPVNESYVSFKSLKEAGSITDEQLTTMTNEYNDKLIAEFSNATAAILSALNAYDEKNAEFNIKGTLAYKSILSDFNQLKVGEVEVKNTFTAEDQGTVKAMADSFRTYQEHITKAETLGTQVVEGATVYNFTEQAYYNFYYALYFEQFDAQLPYYIQVYTHTNWAIIYSLSMFTFAFSIYTVAMRGNTLGRRCVKVQLTDGHDKEKLNPLLALVHDVPFKFLYIIVLGLFSLPIAGIMMLVFTVADLIMIRFTKQHKAIRDYISGTRVIEYRR